MTVASYLHSPFSVVTAARFGGWAFTIIRESDELQADETWAKVRIEFRSKAKIDVGVESSTPHKVQAWAVFEFGVLKASESKVVLWDSKKTVIIETDDSLSPFDNDFTLDPLGAVSGDFSGGRFNIDFQYTVDQNPDDEWYVVVSATKTAGKFESQVDPFTPSTVSGLPVEMYGFNTSIPDAAAAANSQVLLGNLRATPFQFDDLYDGGMSVTILDTETEFTEPENCHFTHSRTDLKLLTKGPFKVNLPYLKSDVGVTVAGMTRDLTTFNRPDFNVNFYSETGFFLLPTHNFASNLSEWNSFGNSPHRFLVNDGGGLETFNAFVAHGVFTGGFMGVTSSLSTGNNSYRFYDFAFFNAADPQFFEMRIVGAMVLFDLGSVTDQAWLMSDLEVTDINKQYLAYGK